jgi:hypothetical protein
MSTSKRVFSTAAMGLLAALAVAGATGAERFATHPESAPAVTTRPFELPAAFARPPTDTDLAGLEDPEIREAVAVLTSDDAGIPESWKPGTAGDLRVLLSGLGDAKRRIFAFVTSRGKLCTGLSGFTSGCLSELPADESVSLTVGDPDQEGTGEGAVVWGLANSDVVDVAIRVDGRTSPARLGSNAFFFQAPGTAKLEALQSIVVRHRNGDVDVTALPTPPWIPSAFGG